MFREKITGTTADRPQLRKLMADLGPGDIVIIPAADRLSRDATDLLVIARKVTLSAMERDSHCRHGRTNAEISACFRSSTRPSDFMVGSGQTPPKHYRE